MTHPTPDSTLSEPLNAAAQPAAAARFAALVACLRRFLTRPPRTGSPSVRLRAHHRCALLLCGGIALSLVGCATSFTGDGIPPGRSTVLGKVVRADSPTVPVANALVTITVTVVGHGVSAGRSTNEYEFYTYSDGTFAANNIPTDSTSSNATISVAPNNSALQTQKIEFILTNNRPSDIIVALPSASFALNKVNSIKLTVQSSTPPPNPSAVLRAQALDASGNDLGILPSLVFDGGLAGITANGTVDVMPNPNVTNPVVGQPLGIVTGTVDTHSTSTPPSATVSPTPPVSTGIGVTGTQPSPSG
jgi:hypothetical protein